VRTEFNADDLPSKIVTPWGNNLVTATDAQSVVTELEYLPIDPSDLGEKWAEVDPRKGSSYVIYNGVGQVRASVDAAGFTNAIAYHPQHGAVIAVTNAKGQVTRPPVEPSPQPSRSPSIFTATKA